PEWDQLLVIDPLIIDWGVSGKDVRPRKLTDLCRMYEVELTDAHDARADALAARGVAIEIGRRYQHVGTRTLPEVVSLQRGWFAEKAEGWNSYARRAGRT